VTLTELIHRVSVVVKIDGRRWNWPPPALMLIASPLAQARGTASQGAWGPPRVGKIWTSAFGNEPPIRFLDNRAYRGTRGSFREMDLLA
jgi:hypothetical protein